MAEYCTVTANFLTMQERGGAPVPVSGRVEFTPTAHAFSGDAVFTQAARTGYVVGGVLYDSPDATTAGVRLVAPSPGVSPERFGYKVTTHLRDGEGRPAPYPCGFIHPTAGGVLNLAEQAPVPDPGSPSGWSVRGPRGEVGPPGVQGERGLPGPQGDPGPKGADGVGVPQKLSIAGSELTLSPDGGTVTLPSTDLSSLVSRADALARRVEALEARPQGGGGGGAVMKPRKRYGLTWEARDTTNVNGNGNNALLRHFLEFDPNTGLGIVHLDFTIQAGKIPSGSLFSIPDTGPVASSLVEMQSVTPGGGGIWIEKGSRQVQTDRISTPGRYILNIVGFFEEK